MGTRVTDTSCRVFSVLAGAFLVAAVLAGCNYAGNSKADFVSAANGVCDTSGATVMPALEDLQHEGLPTESDLRGFAGDVAIPALQKRVDELRQLDPPSNDRHTIDEIISNMQKGIDQIRAHPQELADGDPFLSANADARAYGLKSCVLGTEP